MSWEPLRQWIIAHEQECVTDPDEQSAQASKALRERQERLRELAAERDHNARKNRLKTIPHMSG